MISLFYPEPDDTLLPLITTASLCFSLLSSVPERSMVHAKPDDTFLLAPLFLWAIAATGKNVKTESRDLPRTFSTERRKTAHLSALASVEV